MGKISWALQEFAINLITFQEEHSKNCTEFAQNLIKSHEENLISIARICNKPNYISGEAFKELHKFAQNLIKSQEENLISIARIRNKPDYISSGGAFKELHRFAQNLLNLIRKITKGLQELAISRIKSHKSCKFFHETLLNLTRIARKYTKPPKDLHDILLIL
jgi:hypothetical protein